MVRHRGVPVELGGAEGCSGAGGGAQRRGGAEAQGFAQRRGGSRGAGVRGEGAALIGVLGHQHHAVGDGRGGAPARPPCEQCVQAGADGRPVDAAVDRGVALGRSGVEPDRHVGQRRVAQRLEELVVQGGAVGQQGDAQVGQFGGPQRREEAAEGLRQEGLAAREQESAEPRKCVPERFPEGLRELVRACPHGAAAAHDAVEVARRERRDLQVQGWSRDLVGAGQQGLASADLRLYERCAATPQVDSAGRARAVSQHGARGRARLRRSAARQRSPEAAQLRALPERVDRLVVAASAAQTCVLRGARRDHSARADLELRPRKVAGDGREGRVGHEVAEAQPARGLIGEQPAGCVLP